MSYHFLCKRGIDLGPARTEQFLVKFVNKIRCTENYLELHETELHETNDIYENPIRLIWNLFWYIMSSREILGFGDFFYKIFLDFT